MSPIKLYWCAHDSGGRRNFGDWMSPELVRELSGREVVYANARWADLVAVGSVLQRLTTTWWNKRVHVWGTGLMHAGRPMRPRHHYHAVRGRLTAELLGRTDIPAFGDPGLLVHRLLPGFATVPKCRDIGVVPHHTEQAHPGVGALCARLPGVRVVDITAPTQEFLRELAACRFVLSSSLHGLITADAFQIPNAWITISNELRGGAFKFEDYYSVFGLKPVACAIDAVDSAFVEKACAIYQRPGLDGIRQQLLGSFPFPR